MNASGRWTTEQATGEEHVRYAFADGSVVKRQITPADLRAVIRIQREQHQGEIEQVKSRAKEESDTLIDGMELMIKLDESDRKRAEQRAERDRQRKSKEDGSKGGRPQVNGPSTDRIIERHSALEEKMKVDDKPPSKARAKLVSELASEYRVTSRTANDWVNEAGIRSTRKNK